MDADHGSGVLACSDPEVSSPSELISTGGTARQTGGVLPGENIEDSVKMDLST